MVTLIHSVCVLRHDERLIIQIVDKACDDAVFFQ